MFQDIFQEYVNSTCPELRPQERQKLVLSLTRMAKTWGAQSDLDPDARVKGLEQATNRIALEFGAAPRSFHMAFRCSTKRKNIEEIRNGAQLYLNLLTENLDPSANRDPMKQHDAPQFTIDEIAVESPRMVLVKASIRARVARKADLRRAADKVSRRRKLPVSHIYYPQLPFSEGIESTDQPSRSDLTSAA